MDGWWSGRVGGGEESDWITRPLGRHSVFHTPRATGAPARSGATVFFAHRERLERPLARAPPCFSHHENAWSARPLGRQNQLYAICKKSEPDRLKKRPLGTFLEPPKFIRNPRPESKNLRAPNAIGALARSSAAVFFALLQRARCFPARAPPCFSRIEYAWNAISLGRRRAFRAPSAIGALARSGAAVFFAL